MMKKQRQKCWTIIYSLICLALLAGVLYYEPVTTLDGKEASSRPLLIKHACVINEVEAEPEVCAYKYEMSVSRSIRAAFDSLRYYAGADNQFQGMINYIWSQTGL